MKNVLIGCIIILGIFIVIDYIYTTKNSCTVNTGSSIENVGCGIIKNSFDIDINLFGRYW